MLRTLVVTAIALRRPIHQRHRRRGHDETGGDLAAQYRGIDLRAPRVGHVHDVDSGGLP